MFLLNRHPVSPKKAVPKTCSALVDDLPELVHALLTSLLYYLTSMGRAVVALTSADLLSHSGARSASLCTVDDIPLGVSAATVVLVEILRAHFENWFLWKFERCEGSGATWF
ncbi:hypothetical protein P170DRAFT_209465 [Aspergillus steynii IBT 23096]|uniref:Uncharacterized protein n=1 Tax=Aspergillus steynii IBT 23096 TaxID=1392250 RepID=A0A2I2G5W5_9EURO|nr:uncharacterized protein P170DRAFT_209465 [Aspergillus steynii IBT 23096]PLB48272.1 hypothetical protein P170DRAFT_209465 [Aspergillus steynii IBT 23096]